MKILDYLKDNILYLDGGMGTLLQGRGLRPGELPERFGAEHPEVVEDIHRAYLEAGSDVIYSNTFGANALKFDEDELDLLIGLGIGAGQNMKTDDVLIDVPILRPG
jgi:5-methyltetrahydrofolate--homocysteine methyltransferase